MIPSENAKSGPYSGNGVTTVFPYSFKINDEADIRVVHQSAAGVETDLVLSTDYSVSGVGADNGSATLTSGALALTGEKITLLRSPPFVQEVDLENQGAYFAETIEAALDLLTMQTIALKEQLDRSWKAKLAGTAHSIDDLATGHFWKADADGNMVDGGSASDIANAQANAAIATAQAALAVAAAAAAAASASTIPAVAANTLLVANAGGTVRQNKTFAEVRTLLTVPAWSDLAYFDASQYGVVANGSTDDTAAWATLIAALPANGANILLRGSSLVTSIDLHGKRNIRIIGLGGNGAGASQGTMIVTAAGAVGGRIIDCRDTFNVSFRNVFINATNASFNAILVDYGLITTGSALMSMDDFYLGMNGPGNGLNLYGATQGNFRNGTFAGAGTSLRLQSTVGVGFCNVHNFTNCNFKPSASNFPVVGSGEGITFQSCNVQASSGDGIGRFCTTDLTQPFKGFNLIGCTFYDVLTTGGIWCNFYTGKALNVIGCRFGGAADIASGNNYAIQIGGGTAGSVGAPTGVGGWTVIGNFFDYMTAAVTFAGISSDYNQARAGKVGQNNCFGSLSTGKTQLLASLSVVGSFIIEPNEINAGPNDLGAHFNLRYAGLPTASTGLMTGDLWLNSNVVTAAP